MAHHSIRLALVAVLLIACGSLTPGCSGTIREVVTGRVEPNRHGPDQASLGPDGLYAFREWTTATMEEAPSHRAWFERLAFSSELESRPVWSELPGTDYFGHVLVAHDERANLECTPLSLYRRGTEVTLLGTVPTPTGRMRASSPGSLSPMYDFVGQLTHGNVDPTLCSVRMTGNSITVDSGFRPGVPLPILLSTHPWTPLAIAVSEVRGGYPRKFVLNAGAPILAHFGPIEFLESESGEFKASRTVDGHTISLRVVLREHRDKAFTLAFSTKLTWDRGDVSWLSFCSFKRGKAGPYGELVGSGVGLGTLRSPATPVDMKLDRATAMRFANLLMQGQSQGAPIELNWVRSSSQIPRPEERFPELAEAGNAAKTLWATYGLPLQKLLGLDEQAFLALMAGLGSDPIGAAAPRTRSVYIPLGEVRNLNLLSHELAHVFFPPDRLPFEGATLDEVLAIWIADEGLTEARARRSMGWCGLPGPRIVSVDTESLTGLLLDLVYGYAPEAVPLTGIDGNGALREFGLNTHDLLNGRASGFPTSAGSIRTGSSLGVVPLLLLAGDRLGLASGVSLRQLE